MKALFTAQDPGGANAILPVALHMKKEGARVRAYVAGAAIEIFSNHGIEVIDAGSYPVKDVAEVLESEEADVIIAGTSVGDSIEKKFLQAAGNRRMLAVIDYPSNYWARFSAIGEETSHLPDIICVPDASTKEEMEKEGFPSERVVVTGNPHFDSFETGITTEQEKKERILFISQPLRSVTSLPGFRKLHHDEYGAVEDLILAFAALSPYYHLSIRLHPKESAAKYDSYIHERVSIATEKTLQESLSVSGLIVGIMSPVLMQAAAAGKKVLSYVPEAQDPDPMISNRVGVTTRINTKEDLQRALSEYAAGKWPHVVKPLREFWPKGATERVYRAALELMNRT